MNDFLWNAFQDTGDPLCYLLYRASESCGGWPSRDGDTSVKNAENGCASSA